MYEPTPELTRLYAELGDLGNLYADSTFGLAMQAASNLIPVIGFISWLSSGSELREAKEAVDKFFAARSWYSLDPLRSRLARLLEPDRLRRSGYKLFMTVVDLDSGDVGYVDQEGRLNTREGGVSVDLVEGVIASASLPMVFPPVSLAGGNYVDGGVRIYAPIHKAIEEGAEVVVAIVASSTGELNPQRSGYDTSPWLSTISRSSDILMEVVEEKDSVPPPGWQGQLSIVRPRVQMYDGLTIDPGLIRLSIAYGYMRAFDTLVAPTIVGLNVTRLERLADMIIDLRKLIWMCEYYMHQTYGERDAFKPRLVLPDPWPFKVPETVSGAATAIASSKMNRVHALEHIRRLKRQLFGSVVERLHLGGGLYSPEKALSSWWLGWETHYFLTTRMTGSVTSGGLRVQVQEQGMGGSPWGEVDLGVTRIGSEAPPQLLLEVTTSPRTLVSTRGELTFVVTARDKATQLAMHGSVFHGSKRLGVTGKSLHVSGLPTGTRVGFDVAVPHYPLSRIVVG